MTVQLLFNFLGFYMLVLVCACLLAYTYFLCCAECGEVQNSLYLRGMWSSSMLWYGLVWYIRCQILTHTKKKIKKLNLFIWPSDNSVVCSRRAAVLRSDTVYRQKGTDYVRVSLRIVFTLICFNQNQIASEEFDPRMFWVQLCLWVCYKKGSSMTDIASNMWLPVLHLLLLQA